jgi:hypothetical protein
MVGTLRFAHPTSYMHERSPSTRTASPHMNELELCAYGYVAKAIAQHAFAAAETEDKDCRAAFPDAPGPIYHHWSMSNFEAAAHDLWRLRILRPLDESNGWAFFFVFDCDVDESNLIAERNVSEGPTLFELLVTFINLFGDFGTEYWGFSTRQETRFGRNSRIKPTFDALAALGYLAKSEDGYTWTELIAPAMRASYNSDDWPDPAAAEAGIRIVGWVSEA